MIIPEVWTPEKAGFYSPFRTELREDSDCIYVMHDELWFYSLKLAKWFCVPACFQTDLSSVPRVPVVYEAWGNRAHREGVLHDYVFRKDSDYNLTWMECNSLFLEAMESRGNKWHIRYPMYWGVVLGSYPCYHKRSVTDIL